VTSGLWGGVTDVFKMGGEGITNVGKGLFTEPTKPLQFIPQKVKYGAGWSLLLYGAWWYGSENATLEQNADALQKSLTNLCDGGTDPKKALKNQPLIELSNSEVRNLADDLDVLVDTGTRYPEFLGTGFDDKKFREIIQASKNFPDFCHVYSTYNTNNAGRNYGRYKRGTPFVNFLVSEFAGYIYDDAKPFWSQVMTPINNLKKSADYNEAVNNVLKRATEQNKEKALIKLTTDFPKWNMGDCACLKKYYMESQGTGDMVPSYKKNETDTEEKPYGVIVIGNIGQPQDQYVCDDSGQLFKYRMIPIGKDGTMQNSSTKVQVSCKDLM